MNPIFTKNSVSAKITEEDIEIFKQVAELKYNEKTRLNKKYENDFKLSQDQYQQYQPYLFNVLNQLEDKYFVKALLVGDFKIKFNQIKNKSFLKCYQNGELVLEISLTESQENAIKNKYIPNYEEDSTTYYLIYAGTFIKQNEILTSKLNDLRLIKIAYK